MPDAVIVYWDSDAMIEDNTYVTNQMIYLICACIVFYDEIKCRNMTITFPFDCSSLKVLYDIFIVDSRRKIPKRDAKPMKRSCTLCCYILRIIFVMYVCFPLTIIDPYYLKCMLSFHSYLMTLPSSKIAVAGPGLSGERCDNNNPRDSIFDSYMSINREVSTRLHVPYLNVRSILKEKLPTSYDKYEGYFTLDGEHLNDRGNEEVKEIFLQALRNWSGLWNIQKDEVGVEIMNRMIAHGQLPVNGEDDAKSVDGEDKDVKERKQNRRSGSNERGEQEHIKRDGKVYKFKDRVSRNTRFDDDSRQAKFERQVLLYLESFHQINNHENI